MRPIWRACLAVILGSAVLAIVPAAAVAQQGGGGPNITRAPALSGVAQVGKRIDALGATWTGRPPFSASYTWLRCDSDSLWSCSFIENVPQTTSYTVCPADLGKRLRVVLVVTDRDDRAYAWSAASSVVAAAPAPTPPVPAGAGAGSPPRACSAAGAGP